MNSYTGYGVFEKWSERRRRWFLLTFSAVSWTFFANSLAHLGEHSLGADAVHAIGIVGTLAMWTALIGAFKLPMRHWVFAGLAGITLSAAIVESGLRDGAAAAIWSARCNAGSGQACRQLAEYFDAGRSPVHGWLDAQRLHERACARGVVSSCHEPARADTSTPTERCLAQRLRSQCRLAASLHTERGELDAAYEVEDFACHELGDVDACRDLLDSGYHPRQIAACEVLKPHCRTSSAQHCAVTLRRCERVSSPYAGVD